IVYGPGAATALAAMHARKVVALPLIDAVSGVIKASKLGRLGLIAGVTYVSIDSPVKSTGDAYGSAIVPPSQTPYPNLVTLYPQISGATAAWAQGLTGKNISVAVIDSGINKSYDAIDDGQIEQDALP